MQERPLWHLICLWPLFCPYWISFFYSSTFKSDKMLRPLSRIVLASNHIYGWLLHWDATIPIGHWFRNRVGGFVVVAIALADRQTHFKTRYNGRNPWSNYSKSAVHCSDTVAEGVSGYLPVFCFSEQLLQPLLSPSSCLGNNQSGVAEAWRGEIYSGGVEITKGINSMSSLPPQKSL